MTEQKQERQGESRQVRRARERKAAKIQKRLERMTVTQRQEIGRRMQLLKEIKRQEEAEPPLAASSRSGKDSV